MKLYYIQKSYELATPTPSVYVKADAANQILTTNTMPQPGAFWCPETDLQFTSVSGNILGMRSDLMKVTDFKIVTQAIRSRQFRHDRQVWLYWCDWGIQTLLWGPVPYYQMAAGNKLSTLLSPLYWGRLEVVSFCSPFYNSTFQDSFLTVMANDLVVEGDIEIIVDHGFDNTLDLRNYLLPHIKLTSEGTLTPNQPALIHAEVVDAEGNPYGGDMEIWFETINGYLPYTRKTTTNGTTSVKILALALETGDEIRVKAGTKFVTGLADITLVVEAE